MTMILYKGKPLTVVTMEYLIIAFSDDNNYLPPEGSIAMSIYQDPQLYTTKDIHKCLNGYKKGYKK